MLFKVSPNQLEFMAIVPVYGYKEQNWILIKQDDLADSSVFSLIYDLGSLKQITLKIASAVVLHSLTKQYAEFGARIPPNNPAFSRNKQSSLQQVYLSLSYL